ncbi:glutathione S-transferase N-terminal domain-containing protein [Catenovulum sp. 2E275]|uniref:glutathione S-transferase N-terminal domain-containing protein n=1 Tax=Catenovulum sp. 2E275 TaxID=2980497 RepID=UPI0021D10F04|nr:glutathione S-transferase N-terminal domain-containing protein [Catenovulum sp. 2E275]MCU4674876.1 glutathione S-transferase N-terminal domain-containing protein [Catenovulum sp. 2E275]
MKNLLLKGLREGLGRVIVFVSFITRPKPIKRTPQAQQAVDQAAKQLALYQFYACPFCVKTRRAIHQLNVPIEYRDAKTQPHRQNLEQGGGRVKVPCLRIEDESGVQWMYESNDIIAYLNNRFAQYE